MGDATWFVAHIEPLRPPSCILCNHIVTLLIPDTASNAGSNAYGGRTAQTDMAVAGGWPASVLAKTHIEMDPTRLPSDTKVAFFEVLLPIMPQTQITFGMRLLDENGLSYSVASAELSVSGWRLSVATQTT